jgi:hypothetical protein
MTDESKIPEHLRIKQTPESVWQATSTLLFAIVHALRCRELITGSEIRRACDDLLTQLESQIGDGMPGPGIYGAEDSPLDWNNYVTIAEMLDSSCKEQAYQDFRNTPAARTKEPIPTVVKNSDDGVR